MLESFLFCAHLAFSSGAMQKAGRGWTKGGQVLSDSSNKKKRLRKPNGKYQPPEDGLEVGECDSPAKKAWKSFNNSENFEIFIIVASQSSLQLQGVEFRFC